MIVQTKKKHLRLTREVRKVVEMEVNVLLTMVEVIHHRCHHHCHLSNFCWIILNFAVFDLIRFLLIWRFIQKLFDRIVSHFTAFDFAQQATRYWGLCIKYRNILENNFKRILFVHQIIVYSVEHVPYALNLLKLNLLSVTIVLDALPYFARS